MYSFFLLLQQNYRNNYAETKHHLFATWATIQASSEEQLLFANAKG